MNSINKNTYRWRLHNPGRILSSALNRFEQRVMELMSEAGHSQTRRSHVNLTRHLDLDGTRITDLAKRSAMTNGAMSELIDQCEELGLVERVADPVDKRARIVRFTSGGFEWLDAFGRAVAVAQREMLSEIGSTSMSVVLKDLADYSSAVDGKTD